MSELTQIVEPVVLGMGFELVDIEINGRQLRVYIDRLDRPESGDQHTLNQNQAVTVEDCSVISGQLSRVFAVENIDYSRLEVSSPGMDRPLRKAKDFVRFAGCEANIRLLQPRQNRKNFKGLIITADNESVRLQMGSEEFSFALEDVAQARLVPQWSKANNKIGRGIR